MRILAVSLATILSLFVRGARASEGGPEPTETRPAAVAGTFYPAEARRLKAAVNAFLQAAEAASDAAPIAVVAPHAGYSYSGQVAADAIAQARGHALECIVILGTNHTTPTLKGVAIHPGRAFRTPLGDVEIDTALARKLARACSAAALESGPHEREHSIEVQIPFVQVLWPRAKILPAIVGRADPDVTQAFGEALGTALRDRKALIIASSDLSHYPTHSDACDADRRTLRAIAGMDAKVFRETLRRGESTGKKGLSTCACGEAPILAAMAAAKTLGAHRSRVVSYANSGDTLIGDRDRVVGYGAVAFLGGMEPSDLRAIEESVPPSGEGPLGKEETRILLAFARESIRRYVSTDTVPLPRSSNPRLRVHQGAFVTLKRRGELRGCIGHMSEDRPLLQVVGSMALQAAFNDRRFTPLLEDELEDLLVEISVLTPSKPVASAAEVVPGRDGVILSKDGRRAVFLPQVAREQGWNTAELLSELARKAGLPADAWKEGARLSTFQAEVLHESDGK